ncbi:mucin-5AC-like isoform X6 [Bacillus rossius redtenbacheri]|uniref:mucin-5AC-like isoform X6 n=1 Tax=Bacillus rossius redtenbacheri TaxID=93214 RepID=UPI002FDE1BF3
MLLRSGGACSVLRSLCHRCWPTTCPSRHSAWASRQWTATSSWCPARPTCRWRARWPGASSCWERSWRWWTTCTTGQSSATAGRAGTACRDQPLSMTPSFCTAPCSPCCGGTLRDAATTRPCCTSSTRWGTSLTWGRCWTCAARAWTGVRAGSCSQTATSATCAATRPSATSRTCPSASRCTWRGWTSCWRTHGARSTCSDGSSRTTSWTPSGTRWRRARQATTSARVGAAGSWWRHCRSPARRSALASWRTTGARTRPAWRPCSGCTVSCSCRASSRPTRTGSGAPSWRGRAPVRARSGVCSDACWPRCTGATSRPVRPLSCYSQCAGQRWRTHSALCKT